MGVVNYSGMLVELATTLAQLGPKVTAQQLQSLTSLCPPLIAPVAKPAEAPELSNHESARAADEVPPRKVLMSLRNQEHILAVTLYEVKSVGHWHNRLLAPLLAYLRTLGEYSWETSMIWKDTSAPESFAARFVSHLLDLAHVVPSVAHSVFDAISSAFDSLLDKLDRLASQDATLCIQAIIPLLRGLLCGVASSGNPLDWQLVMLFERNSQQILSKVEDIDALISSFVARVGSHGSSSEAERDCIDTLAHYNSIRMPLEGASIAFWTYQVIDHIFAGSHERSKVWHELIHSKTADFTSHRFWRHSDLHTSSQSESDHSRAQHHHHHHQKQHFDHDSEKHAQEEAALLRWGEVAFEAWKAKVSQLLAAKHQAQTDFYLAEIILFLLRIMVMAGSRKASFASKILQRLQYFLEAQEKSLASNFEHHDQLHTCVARIRCSLPWREQTDLISSTLEGICILSLSHPPIQEQALETFKRILTQPSKLVYGAVPKVFASLFNTNSLHNPENQAANQLKFLSDQHFVKLSNSIRATVVTCLATSISSCGHKNPVDLATANVYSFSNALYEADSGSEMAPITVKEKLKLEDFTRQIVIENVVEVVGSIAAFIKNVKVTETVLSFLTRRLGHPPSSLDAVILRKLALIAASVGHQTLESGSKFGIVDAPREEAATTPLKGDNTDENGHLLESSAAQRSAFREILEYFSQIGRAESNFDLGFGHRLSETALDEAEFYLAEAIEAKPELYEDFLLHILNLFIDVGVTTQQIAASNPNVQVSSLVGRLGVHLPVLRALLSHDDINPEAYVAANKESAEKVSRLFRNFWFYCTLFAFVKEGMWLDDWYTSLNNISAKSPLLVGGKATNFLDSELNLNSVLRQGVTCIQDLQQLRANLISLIPYQAVLIRSLSFAQTTYVLSIYHLESRRTKNKRELKSILKYIEDEGIANSVTAPCVYAVIDQIVDMFINFMRVESREVSRERALETAACVLITSGCHRVKRVHEAARKYLDRLEHAFPQLLWKKDILRLLLEVLEVLLHSVEFEYDQEYNPVIDVPYLGSQFVIDLSEDRQYRQEILENYVLFCHRWLETAVESAPAEIQGMLHVYLADLERICAEKKEHIGYNLALLVGSKLHAETDRSLPSGLSQQVMETTTHMSSTFISSLAMKCQHIGEVNGMRSVYELHQDVLSDRIVTSLKDSLQKIVDDLQTVKPALASKDLNTILHRAAALIVSSKEYDTDLLHLICWTPVLVFTASAMQSAVSVWTWMIVSRPELDLRVMSEILAAWEWSIHNRKGLFSSEENSKSPFVSKITYTPSDKAVKLDQTSEFLTPHMIWIKFLIDRFEVVRFRSQEHVDIYVKFVRKAFDHRDHISTHPSSRATRFKLLLLAMKLIQDRQVLDTLAEYLLRYRVYETALAWFESPPMWSGSSNWRIAASEISILARFYRVVHGDEEFFKQRMVASDILEPVPSMSTLELPRLASLPNGTLDTIHASASANAMSPTSTAALGIPSSIASTYGGGGTTINTSGGISTNSNIAPMNSTNVGTGGGVSASSNAAAGVIKGQVSNAGAHTFSTEVHGGSLNGLATSATATGSVGGIGTGIDGSIAAGLADSRDHNINSPRRTPRGGDNGSGSGGDKTQLHVIEHFKNSRQLLLLLLENEVERLATWRNPSNDPTRATKDEKIFAQISYNKPAPNWKALLPIAFDISAALAIQLGNRFHQEQVRAELRRLVSERPEACIHIPDAVQYLLTEQNIQENVPQLKHLLFWAPVPPITAISLFSPMYKSHPIIVQYAVRVLQHFPPEIVFFYIPQIVQALRFDTLGYVEQYILNTAKISQLFAHQIIWNMNANMFITFDETSPKPDPLKPTLERMVEKIVTQLSGEDKDFYDREFKFFNLVTGISGKLKPFIKKSKPEKKKKIDEELRAIKVDPGVYLPSNPESIVVDIDYNSGRPLQSHAKAPFMATFKIVQAGMASKPGARDMRQSAIFKVGDDCRQDLLALQLIAIVKTICAAVGLETYLFPYRVVATAPGCGIIEVIPNSISRDQLGREKINSIYDYFLAKYGNESTIGFQKARNAFVRSAAAYSVILFLLQIRDRHNGNIMLNDDGNLIHIDFGFILDISPGGNLGFERSPFKLNTEMIQVMGGSADAAPFKWFVDLCIKAFLAARPHAEQITQMVTLMSLSGLPCFRGEQSIRNFRSRFQLDCSESAAAQFMKKKIDTSFLNSTTVFYDMFQKLQNGIPY